MRTRLLDRKRVPSYLGVRILQTSRQHSQNPEEAHKGKDNITYQELFICAVKTARANDCVLPTRLFHR